MNAPPGLLDAVDGFRDEVDSTRAAATWYDVEAEGPRNASVVLRQLQPECVTCLPNVPDLARDAVPRRIAFDDTHERDPVGVDGSRRVAVGMNELIMRGPEWPVLQRELGALAASCRASLAFVLDTGNILWSMAPATTPDRLRRRT